MPKGTFVVPDLQDLYSRPHDAEFKMWREHGARYKAENILALTKEFRSEITSVLEVGCGTGDVLIELCRRELGERLVGIEIGINPGGENKNLSRERPVIHAYDGKRIPYPDDSFDLVYATHVLEHVLDERGFLSELKRVSKMFIVVEVPCELHLRTTYQTLQTTLNIGHINAYTPESFALTLETSGLTVARIETFEPGPFLSGGSGRQLKQKAKSALRRAVLSVSPYLAHRIFSYHVAALCRPGRSLTI
jgi:SAM-dependent methyltransferase